MNTRESSGLPPPFDTGLPYTIFINLDIENGAIGILEHICFDNNKMFKNYD